MKLFNKFKLQERKRDLKEIISSLLNLQNQINDPSLFDTLQQIQTHSADPFTFVIVGEVKAGKSSFINALLESEKEICKVAPSPMTDTIQLITYGEEEKEVVINPYFRKVFTPIEILKDVGIVDTPGTNTIIEHHQEITERFIPSADLIIFVFEAKNPYRESAWQFFDFIHSEWRKKIIFILQQKDLLSMEDLAINIQGVKEYALKKGIASPNIFAVSAKQEIDNDHSNSGFLAVRDYISEQITDGKAPILKIQNATQTIGQLVNRIENALEERTLQHQRDKKFRTDIDEILENQTKKSTKQAEIFTENIVASYENISRKYEKELKQSLSFFTLLKRSFSSMFGSKKSIKVWVENLNENFEKELNSELKLKLSEGIVHLSDSVQQMGLLIDLKLKDSPKILKESSEIFFEINSKRRQTMSELHLSFQEFLQKTENFIARETQGDESISPSIATGSGVAVIGVILSTVASGLVFDITGGVLTAIGLAFAGISAGLKRNKIIKQFRKEVDKGKTELEINLLEKLSGYIVELNEKINAQFQNFDKLISDEQLQIESFKESMETITKDLKDLESKLDFKMVRIKDN